MITRLISRFSGEFESRTREQVFLAATWPQTAFHLRIAASIAIIGLLSSIYLYYLFFGTGFEFQALALLQIFIIIIMVGLFSFTRRDFYTLTARLLSLSAQLLFSISELMEYHFLLHNQSYSEVGTPFIVVLILIYYAFVPNRTYITVLATSFASIIFLCYYYFSPDIPFERFIMLLIELAVVNLIGYLFLINWNWLRRLEFAQRKELEDEISKRIEAEKVAREASAAKTRFLASASHDLRQPLQAQRLYVETMVAQAKEKPIRELGGKVVSSQRSMQKMLDALLDLSRLDAGMITPRFTDVSLKRLFLRLEREFSSLADNKGLLFHLHWPPDDATVSSDPGMLDSMLHNLISNAIQYTDQGAVMLAARRRGSQWQLEVRDSGKGIAEEQQQKIFEEFYQLGNPERDREKGLGLGLSIVRHLAQLLEHKLSLFSRPGRGSVFALRLPVGLFPASEKLQAPGSSLFDLSAYHILIIDDEFSIRDGMACALELYGCKVAQAADRQAAATVVRQHRPDVMVVDYRLAEGENGIDLIKYLNACAGVDIPALLLTGDTSPEVLQTIERSGIPALHKPVALKELVQSLQGLLESANSA